MCGRFSLEPVEISFIDRINNYIVFVRKTVLFSGDFRQILPAVPGGSRAQILTRVLASHYYLDPSGRLVYLTTCV